MRNRGDKRDEGDKIDKIDKEMRQATPVGFEPTRGDPIGLAGRRLSHSAKVSWYCGSALHGCFTMAPPATAPAASEARLRGRRMKKGGEKGTER